MALSLHRAIMNHPAWQKVHIQMSLDNDITTGEMCDALEYAFPSDLVTRFDLMNEEMIKKEYQRSLDAWNDRS